MINLKDIKNQKFNLIQVIKILFYTFPISFIIGNLVLSLHLLLFVVFSLFLITKKQLNLRFKNSYWLLIAFFLYLFLLTTIQFQSSEFLKETTREWPLESDPIFKSFILIRNRENATPERQVEKSEEANELISSWKYKKLHSISRICTVLNMILSKGF